MGKLLKLGGEGLPRVYPHRPKPPAVEDHYSNHTVETGELSERCQWWLEMIERGWRPNRRTLNCCWDCNAEWLGVYGWEYTDVICPALGNGRFGDYERTNAIRKEECAALTPLGPKTALDAFTEQMVLDMHAMLQEEVDRLILHGEGSG